MLSRCNSDLRSALSGLVPNLQAYKEGTQGLAHLETSTLCEPFKGFPDLTDEIPRGQEHESSQASDDSLLQGLR